MYSRILLPTDGSEEAEQAIDEGVKQARESGATIHGLYVVDKRFHGTHHETTPTDEQDRGERALATVGQKSEEADVPFESHLRRGVPHEEIIGAIEGLDVDLVVMGTHGRTGIARVTSLGSVTGRVVRAARVPVLTVPLGDPQQRPQPDTESPAYQ
jgi:nucleotide-binding universal stress UspA family protein